jgi:hypothetical protein
VALLAMGQGVRRGTFGTPVTLAAVAPLVGRLLGIDVAPEPDAGRFDAALRDRRGAESR